MPGAVADGSDEVTRDQVAPPGEQPLPPATPRQPIPAKTDHANGPPHHPLNPHNYYARAAQTAQQPKTMPGDRIGRARAESISISPRASKA
jgi:hypothetical protein